MAEPKYEFITPTIQGDPSIALIAQINRFRQATRSTAPQLPLVPGVSNEVAINALTLLQTRAIVAAIDDPNAAVIVAELSEALKNPVAYVSPRAGQLALQIALYGDSLGYPPAKVGITTRDPRVTPKWDVWMYTSVIGTMAIGAMIIAGVARRLARRTTARAA